MWIWFLFISLIGVLLALDLGVFNKGSHEISYKEATRWTILWTSVGLLFSFVILIIYKYQVGPGASGNAPWQACMEYLTGYVIELTLSVDNIFVIALIFKSFRIPKKNQHRVLFWGILGALVFRGLMIVFGVYLISKFSWTSYVFGIFLILTALKMAFSKEEDKFDPRNSFIYRSIRKILPVSSHLNGENFFIKKRNIVIATPLFLALVLIEFTDILFALDSIPAILGITRDPFLVFTSNIFAILGLRSMYFFIANMLDSFHYLKHSLTVILIYVGVKLILENHFHLNIGISLSVIFFSLLVGILLSLKYKESHGIHDLKNN